MTDLRPQEVPPLQETSPRASYKTDLIREIWYDCDDLDVGWLQATQARDRLLTGRGWLEQQLPADRRGVGRP